MTATMTKAKRHHEILGAMRVNETLGELDKAAQGLTGPMAAAVNRVYDSLTFQLWDHTLDLVKKNLGPRNQKRLMLVLKAVGEVIDQEKAEHSKRFLDLPVTPEEAQWDRELQEFEKLFLFRAKDILRAIAEYNSTKVNEKNQISSKF